MRGLHASPELVAGGPRRQHPKLGTPERDRPLLPGVSNRLSGGRYPLQQFSCFWITQVVAEVPGDRNVVLPVDAADPGHDAIPVSPFLTEALIRNDCKSLDPDRVRTAPQQDVTRSALAAGTVLQRSRETCTDSQGCHLKLKIPHTTTRHLIVVLIETGLRGGDACNLPFNPVLTDSSGWPCLRFEAVKVRAEQLIPLSAKAAAAIRAQQDYVRQRWPAGSPWLFPGMTGNDDGSKPYSHSAFIQQLRRWQRVIDLRDEAGQPVTVTGHQFRHTLGTRLINSGVPQHVVQRLPGHASPHMTSHYAKVHDTTIREAFDRYQSQRVNISGQQIGYDPGSPAASAEWVKHNLNRVRDSLPNGYCARPAQQDCPHPNACLTCPDFQTTPQFLQIHRRQAAANSRLIEQAEGKGQLRLAENLRRVQANLDRIIPALEALQDDGPRDEPS